MVPKLALDAAPITGEPGAMRVFQSRRSAAIAALYGRSVVIVSKASDTSKIRATIGMPSPARPSG